MQALPERAAQSKRPDFFIVGAPRCGTTTLYAWLKNRSEIYLPARKELHHFSADYVRDSYYRPIIVDTSAEYRACFARCAPESIAGDCSPSYFAYPPTAARIHEFNSNAKILVILRDPVLRAISHYRMDVDKGVRAGPLSAYLAADKRNTREYTEYVGNSLYSESLKRYLKVFPASQVMVIVAEDLWADPQSIARSILLHLGSHSDEVAWTWRIENAGSSATLRVVRDGLRLPIVRRIAQHIPPNAKRAFKRVLTRRIPSSNERYQITPADYSLLKELLIQDVECLSKLLGRNLSDVWTETFRRGPS